MKFPPNSNPALVCSKDPVRYLLQNVLLKDRLAVATDGRQLVALVTTPDDNDEPGPQLVPVKAVTKACARRKQVFAQSLRLKDREAVVEAFGENTSFTTMDAESVEKFPRYEGLVIQASAPADKVVTVSINAKLLFNLAKAMGDERVTLHIDLDRLGDPMLVLTSSPLAAGLLCPCRVISPDEENQALAIIRSLRP